MHNAHPVFYELILLPMIIDKKLIVREENQKFDFILGSS